MGFLYKRWMYYSGSNAVTGVPSLTNLGGGYLLGEINSFCETDVTIVRTRYRVDVHTTVALNADGTSPTSGLYWAGLLPMINMIYEPFTLGPYPVFSDGGGTNPSPASDMGQLKATWTAPPDEFSTTPYLGTTWSMQGETEGMRKLTGPVDAMSAMIFSWGHTSTPVYAETPPPGWALWCDVWFKTLFCSDTPQF